MATASADLVLGGSAMVAGARTVTRRIAQEPITIVMPGRATIVVRTSPVVIEVDLDYIDSTPASITRFASMAAVGPSPSMAIDASATVPPRVASVDLVHSGATLAATAASYPLREATADLNHSGATMAATSQFIAVVEATADLQGPAATLAAAAVFGAGVYTASAALDGPAATMAADAEFYPLREAEADLVLGGAILAAEATFGPSDYTATALIVAKPFFVAGSLTYGLLRSSVAAMDGPAATMSASATADAPIFSATSAMQLGTRSYQTWQDGEAHEWQDGSVHEWQGGISFSASATFVAIGYNATAALAHSGATFAATATRTNPTYTATQCSMVGPGLEGAATATTVEETFLATAFIGISGATFAAAAERTVPVFTATTADLVHSGATMAAVGQSWRKATAALAHSGATMAAQATFTGPPANGTASLSPVSPATSGYILVGPPPQPTATAALAHSGATFTAAAQSYQHNATAALLHSGPLMSAAASFVQTTPLSQPGWLQWTEDYIKTKPGVAYNANTYATIFTETNALIATDTTTFNAHLATAKSNASIRAIYLTPGTTYSLSTNLLTGLARTFANGLVIRTLPGAATQAVCSGINQTQFFSGVCLVDLEFTGGISMTGGATDLCIERCKTYLTLAGVAPPGSYAVTTWMTNVHLRLNVIADRFVAGSNVVGIYLFGIDGLLFEGNVVDHNGWDPAATRATSPTTGGANSNRHNIQAIRPVLDAHFRYNLISRAGAHGLFAQGGGMIRHNLFVRNPIAMQIGFGGSGSYAALGVVTNKICEGNLAIGADDINTGTGELRGIFIQCTCVSGQVVMNNTCVDNGTDPTNDAVLWIENNYPISMSILGFKAKSWPGPLEQRQTGFTPVINDLGAHNYTAGLAGSAQTLADTLKSDSYLNTQKTSRVRLGVDIAQLKTDMANVVAGIT